MRRSTAFASAAMAAALAFVVPAVANAAAPTPTRFGVVVMTGAQETGNADPDGQAVFAFVAGRGQLCYAMTVRNIDPATLSHIHRGVTGVAGPIVIMLTAPTNGASSGCIAAVPDSQQTPANAMATLTDSELADIINNTANYYANVHNAPFPAGAIRAQLAS